MQERAARLKDEGCEVGVHGIDAWHDRDKGRDELARIGAVTAERRIGIRMHWLLRNAETASILDESGFLYDSTVGYNETVGYRAGTSQVFRPIGAHASRARCTSRMGVFSNRPDLSDRSGSTLQT